MAALAMLIALGLGGHAAAQSPTGGGVQQGTGPGRAQPVPQQQQRLVYSSCEACRAAGCESGAAGGAGACFMTPSGCNCMMRELSPSQLGGQSRPTR